MGKIVLVTGAAGFIGRYTVQKLREKGYGIIALVRKTEEKTGEDVSVIQVDISDAGMVQYVADKIDQCDAIVHLAANLDMRGSEETIAVNCTGTYHLIQLAERLRAKKFIYISSIPVIGIPKELPITEEHPVAPGTLYHISKYMGEQMVETLCPAWTQKTILRIPSPVGVGMSEKNYLSFLLHRCWNNEPIEVYGQGLRRQNYIDVRDIVSAIERAVEIDTEGLFLIAGRRDITNRELAFLCKEITHSSSEITWGLREDPEEKNQWIISAEKAQKYLGFTPEYEIEDTVRWLENEKAKV